jgi:hypothetical protein
MKVFAAVLMFVGLVGCADLTQHPQTVKANSTGVPEVSEEHRNAWVKLMRDIVELNHQKGKIEKQIMADCGFTGYQAEFIPDQQAFRCTKPAPVPQQEPKK